MLPPRKIVPNALTVARLPLAAATFGCWAVGPHPILSWVGLAAFLLAALTDALDGHLARRWGVESLVGRILDPFADKVLILGTVVILAGPGWHESSGSISGWTPIMAVLVLARELFVTSARAILEAEGVDYRARAIGKWKMVLQSACLPAVVLLVQVAPEMAAKCATPMAWVVTIVTVLSGLDYVGAMRSGLREVNA